MTNDVKYADRDFMLKQKAIFEILMNVWQPEWHNTYYDEIKDFDVTSFKSMVKIEDAYQCFYDCYEKGFMGMEEIFRPLDHEQSVQFFAVFKMFYYANDWNSFYKFMLWSRFNINPGMFIQALTMAVLQRDDFAGFVLPAIYEISPFYFFNNYVITKARRSEMLGKENWEKVDGSDVYTYTIDTKYTNNYLTTNQESRLAYFMEGNVLCVFVRTC
jgi:hypothetical protein